MLYPTDTPDGFASEDIFQAEAYKFLNNTYAETRGLFFAIPNGGWRHPGQIKMLQATGTRKGVHDMQLMWQPHSVFFELKNGNDTQPSKEQLEFAVLATGKGYKCYLIRDLTTFKKIFHNIVRDGFYPTTNLLSAVSSTW